MNLYLTADVIGIPSGGGLVTFHESEAFKELGECEVWDRTKLSGGGDPWGWDDVAADLLRYSKVPKLCHIYSGSFPKTAAVLKARGCKLVWTIAAHDRHVSRREHEQLGLQFPYPHLVEEPFWQRYIEGYRLADVIICPSMVARVTVQSYGPAFASKDIRMVPHGCTLPDTLVPLPKRFVCGYMGSFGADKGVRYLLEAWKQLAYQDATLVLAGRDSTSPWARHLIQTYGGGNIQCLGWVNDPTDFYNSISCYVQSSATEGFGLEVLESASCGRSVICSDGAGAVDLMPNNPFSINGHSYAPKACDVGELITCIDDRYHEHKSRKDWVPNSMWRDIAKKCEWPIIHKKYIEIWRELPV